MTGAKKTRLGCDSPSERFQNIVEAPALWHTKQSFLGVSEIHKHYMIVLFYEFGEKIFPVSQSLSLR